MSQVRKLPPAGAISQLLAGKGIKLCEKVDDAAQGQALRKKVIK